MPRSWPAGTDLRTRADHRLMRVLRAVVGAQSLLVRTREANFAKRRPVGSQLVGDDSRRNETLVTKEFAEQPQCRDLVALGLNENFENLRCQRHATCTFGVRRSRPPFRRDANECKVWAYSLVNFWQ